MKENYFSVIKNPMTIIVLFIGLIEISFGLSISKIPETFQSPFFWFMVIFPCICALGFFIVLIFKPHHFYGPSDFRSDEAYLTINQRINDIENFTKLIDNKIESMPLYRFPKINECARILFLRIYGSDNTYDEIISDTKKKYSEKDIQTAIQELISEEWLSKVNNSIILTPKGENDYAILAQFVYGRWA